MSEPAPAYIASLLEVFSEEQLALILRLSANAMQSGGVVDLTIRFKSHAPRWIRLVDDRWEVMPKVEE